MKRIYLDYASLTPVDRKVFSIIKKYSDPKYTNPSALYQSAIDAKLAVDEAKTRIAEIIHAHSDELIFTSGGTESNQIVLNAFKDKKVLISSIEHSSIFFNSIDNANIIKIKVDKNGLLDLEDFKSKLTPDVALVSVMMVNNEIGTVEAISEIAKIIRDTNKKFNSNILFHTDASQAVAHYDLFVEKMGIDLMTLDGNKVYGPRSTGILYIKRGKIKLERQGTLNVPGIVGISYALEIAQRIKIKETKRIVDLRDFFIMELKKINKDIKINGDLSNTSPHILNISIPNIDNEFFVLKLDAKGIECSTKSACLRDEDESYVLKAIDADSKTSVRFSFGRMTSKGELKRVLKVICDILL
jgi:cysteine desulfurase